MPDYGHDLEFGAFLTPSADQPEQVVALAGLAERAGLDLVTFQDHPYQPAFLDTWTLLSHVAATTSTVHLAPNVANLPLRPPAVLARSVASLDLLSSGRMELGLGAGAFWDAIEAMGGRRLSPGQAVQALTEALAVIRGVWDVAERRPLRVDGDFYRVAGAKRGPAPAHEVGIWLGAYKPRMLALTGRLADGWLPSLGYLDVADLPSSNAVIDEAAEEAGRRPAAVRRLLNVTGRFGVAAEGFLDGPPSRWAEDLAALALDHGVSTFVLGTDDPRSLQVFGQEVAPAVREAVAAGRAGRSAGTAGATPAPAPVPTAPPQVRLGDHPLLDETTRPRSPRAERQDGDGFGERERALGQHLVEVHDMLRGELEQVRGIVDQVRSGALDPAAARTEINRLTLRQNAWTMGAYCASYCRLVTQHHTLEDDSVFPHLRAADPELAPVLDRLAEEHLAIHGVLDAVDRALVAVVEEPDGDGHGDAGPVTSSAAPAHRPGRYEGLQAQVDALTDTLLSHFAYEEEQLVVPLARHGFYPGQR